METNENYFKNDHFVVIPRGEYDKMKTEQIVSNNQIQNLKNQLNSYSTKTWVSINEYRKLNSVKSRTTVYNHIHTGKVVSKRVGSRYKILS